MKRVLTVFFTIMISVAANAQTVTGTVKDGEGQQLANISVTVEGTFLGTITNADGYYELNLGTAGVYVLKAGAVGFAGSQQTVNLQAGTTTTADFILQKSYSSLKEVTITASRKAEIIDRTPASVQVLHANEIQSQAAISSSLSNILGYAVPSLGFSSNTTSNTGQTLRGRTPLILIDGIPQSTPLRNGARDIRTIDPSVIQRIEVIKGATAIYGNGADGGVINYITAVPSTSNKINGYTSVAKTGSVVHSNETGGFRVNQKLSGKLKAFDYIVSGLYEKTGVNKDAKGGIISPVYGYGETGLYNIFSKLGYNLNKTNRLEVMYNYFGSRQNSEYIEHLGVAGKTPTTGVKGTVLSEDEGTRYNHNAYVKYLAKKLFLNTSLEASVYLQKFYTVYGWSQSFVPAGQSTIHSDKKGARLTLNSPFKLGEHVQNELVYGVDYLDDVTWQDLTDGRLWVPKMNLHNAAPFAQLHTTIHDYWILKAGYRLDQVDLDIPTFTQIKTSQAAGGQVINGGNLNFSASTFNVGARYAKWDVFNPFVSFTQGFSMVDIGLYVRSARENDIAKMQLQPIIANNYEAGFTSSFSKISFSASAYASTSKVGSSIVEENGYFLQQRVPERVYGLEGTVDVASVKNFFFGAGVSYMEGKADMNKNGNYDDAEDVYLNGRRITPLKLTTHVKYAPGDRLYINVDWLYSGSRKRFLPQSNGTYRFGEGPVSSYGIVNVNGNYKLKNGLSFFGGVENLLNKDYYPTTSQWYGLNAYYIKANGARYQLGIGYKW